MDQEIEKLIQKFRERPSVKASAGTESVDRLTAGVDTLQKTSRAPVLATDIARLIDHTALKPDTSAEDIESLCQEALDYSFASVCINPCYVRLASKLLRGSEVAVCTVIGFPLGATTMEAKVREAERAVTDGAREVDMVLNLGMLKSGAYDYVEADIRSVVDAVDDSIVTKVVLETALLSNEEKAIACVISQSAGADFVKTSTGFSSGGATTEDISLMRRIVGKDMGVKASGGIRTAATARAMIEAGATRIGASSSVAIVRAEEGGSSAY